MKRIIYMAILAVLCVSVNAEARGRTFGGGKTDVPVVFVAASDATAEEQKYADYKCDGTDDDVQINAALGTGNVRVELSSGTFLTGTSVSMPTDSALIGQGQGITEIKLADGTASAGSPEIEVIGNSDPLSGNTSIYIQHITVNGNVDNQSWNPAADVGGSGIGMNFANLVTIRDVEVKNCWRHGVWYHNNDGNGSGGVLIDNVTVDRVGSSCISVGGQAHYKRFTTNATVQNCTLSRALDSVGRPSTGAMLIEVNDHVKNMLIKNNMTSQSDNSGIGIYMHIGGDANQDISNISIVGNTIKDVDQRGIYMYSDGGFDIHNINIIDNMVIENDLQGILIYHITGHLYDINVSGNLVADNLRDGIYLYGSGVTGVNITNNLITGNAREGIKTDGTDVLIQGNTIDRNGYGGIIAQADASEIIIAGNSITHNTEDGIELVSGSEKIVITGNKIRGNREPINDDSAAGCVYADNYVDDIQTLTSGVSPYHFGTTYLDSSGGASSGTLVDGAFVGQEKLFVMTSAAGNWDLTISHHETEDDEIARFDAVDEYLSLKWTGTEWVTVSNTCTFP